MLFDQPQYRLMGDRALLIELGDKISPDVNQKVRELFVGLDQQALDGLIELVPSYRSLMVVYDPLVISLQTLKAHISDTADQLDKLKLPPPKTAEIPVVYGEKYGPDLEWVAQYHNISADEVVHLHTQPTYRVYLVGFMPGYPYLGEVPDALSTPRRKTPRTHVPRGSVGIAQKQSGIYPVESPGGWQILGRTPVNLFDPQRQPPSILEMGDFVKFYPIAEEELEKWQQHA
jgi:KipI family sensor histidine kinase inhibitor